MRRMWSVMFVLAACGGSSRNAAPAEPKPEPEAPQVTAPEGGTVVAGEDGEAARAGFAIGFVQAVMHHDDAAIAAYTDPRGFCSSAVPPEALEEDPQIIDKCADEMAKDNELGITMYEEYIPATFEPGETQSYPLAPEKGVYMVMVLPSDGDLEKGVAVTVVEVKERRYVMFPRKKD